MRRMIRGPIFTRWYESIAFLAGVLIGVGLGIWAVIK